MRSLITQQRCNRATGHRSVGEAMLPRGRLGRRRRSLTCAAVGCPTREDQRRIRNARPINSTASQQVAEQRQHQHAAQQKQTPQRCTQRNRTPTARHSRAFRSGRYRMSRLSRHFLWQRLLVGRCARGRVLDSAPSRRVVPQQGRRHPCRLLVPAISGCCSLPLRLRWPRGGMCARNRPSVMLTAQRRLLHRWRRSALPHRSRTRQQRTMPRCSCHIAMRWKRNRICIATRSNCSSRCVPVMHRQGGG